MTNQTTDDLPDQIIERMFKAARNDKVVTKIVVTLASWSRLRASGIYGYITTEHDGYRLFGIEVALDNKIPADPGFELVEVSVGYEVRAFGE